MICVNSVSVSPKNITLKLGTWYYSAYATVSPSNATCTSVTWHSDKPTVASVNASTGYIYGNGVGTAKIYATAIDGSGCTDYLTVTVENKILVTSVTLNCTSLTLKEGQNYALSANVSPSNASNKTLNWNSSNNNVAKVNNGVVTAVSQGTAKITACATDGSGKGASCTVTVTRDTLVSYICVSPNGKEMTTGESAYFYATVCPENATNRCVTWSSSDPCVATVNPTSGLVYAQNPGTTIISAIAQDGSGTVGTSNLTVKDPVLVEDITLGNSNIFLYKGGVFTLDATVCPVDAANKALCWSSSNTTVAIVDPYTGLITAKAVGRTTVYAAAQDGSGVVACCKVDVRQTAITPVEETPVNKVKESNPTTPIDVYTGAHLLDNTLISLQGGVGIQLVAHYDSTKLSRGELGYGWHHNYEKHIELDGDGILVYSSPSVFAKYVAQSDCCTVYTCNSPNRNGYVLTLDTTGIYSYTINCNSTQTEYYDIHGKLVKIVDHQGFETLITHSNDIVTITDGITGQRVHLLKDSNGVVFYIYDDAGRTVNLSYQNNLLTAFADANDNTITYTYDEEGRVLTAKGADNIYHFQNTYDSYGRVIEQKDGIPGSVKSAISYVDNKRIKTDRTGKDSISEYDCNGLLVKYTDENGYTKTYEYDERYNVTKETDATGKSIVKKYNRFNNPTEVTDKNGNTTYYSYDTVGNLLSIRYPETGGVSAEEFFTYNSRNQVVQHTDVRGTVTVYTYDSNGMPASKKVGSRNAVTYSYQNGLLKSQTDAMGNTTTYVHNEIGQVTSVIDANNKVTQYEYDAIGNLLRTIDANGKSIVNTYDGNYQKTSVTDANGNKTEYSYNGNMKNDAIVFPDGNRIRYVFDGEDRIVQVIDQQNNTSNITYDDGGRVISKRLPDGAMMRYDYDAVGNVIKEINPKGAVVTKTYDNNGNVLSVKDHEGNTTLYEYNATSKVTKVTNSVAGTTVYEYSKSGDLLSETDAIGNKKTYTYDTFGNRTSVTDAKNNVTIYTYDANNNLISVKDPLTHITTYSYNCLNQCISVKDALNNVISYGYDALGRRTSITDARGNTFTTIYDGNGNVVKTLDAKGNTINETVYNSLNLPLTVTDAMGKVTSYTYNAIGKVESVVDSLNHRTEYTYNSRGQNTSVRDASNNTSTASYDLLGNVTSLAGPLGGATNYAYDDMGRLTSESTVSGGAVLYTYNELNLRKKLTNARGQIRQFFYDSKGRITGYSSTEGSASYTYDANDNVLTVTDSQGTITRTYDALNRVTSYTDTQGKVIRYEYDAVGNLTRLIYPDNTAVTYAYDANHNLISVTDWMNRVTSYTYDANNRVVGVTKPDGSVTTTAYDNMQRVTYTVERTAIGSVITGFEYSYDNLSNIVEERDLSKSIKMCYTYDNLNRVTTRTIKNLSDDTIVSSESFSYDAAGNITDAPDSCFQYDNNNRLIVFNGNPVSYDMDGNMLNNGVHTFVYDSSNRLISAGDHTYTYNAENVRIRNLCEDEDTTYTYNTNCQLSQLLMKTTNGAVSKYVYGRGLIGEETGNVFKTYHFDSRGTTIALTDANGNITDTFSYDTYGKVLSRTGTNEIIFGFNGRDGVVTDKNGLIYMRARYYSPDMKRFINADIVAGMISNAVTLNRYAYANGNPVSFVDPFGLSATYSKQAEWHKAVLVADFSVLKKVGHAEIYFQNKEGKWMKTEFNTTAGVSGAKNKKKATQIWVDEDIELQDLPFYDQTSGKYITNPSNINYVVLTGDFDKSVALAKSYNNWDYGGYNFVFRNCSDYIDELLDAADLDTPIGRLYSEDILPISIPRVREYFISNALKRERKRNEVCNYLISTGEAMYGDNFFSNIAAAVLVGTGYTVKVTTDFMTEATAEVCNIIGEVVDCATFAAAKTTNWIIDQKIKRINREISTAKKILKFFSII